MYEDMLQKRGAQLEDVIPAVVNMDVATSTMISMICAKRRVFDAFRNIMTTLSQLFQCAVSKISSRRPLPSYHHSGCIFVVFVAYM